MYSNTFGGQVPARWPGVVAVHELLLQGRDERLGDGVSMAESIEAPLVVAALEMAVARLLGRPFFVGTYNGPDSVSAVLRANAHYHRTPAPPNSPPLDELAYDGLNLRADHLTT